MSNYESSYYEIALTHRQVVVSFVVLLVFVLAVFLCGVWVGKNGTGDPVGAPRRDETQVAGNGSGAVLGDLSAVEEYSFDHQAGEDQSGRDQAAKIDGGGSPADDRTADPERLDKPDLSVLDDPTPQTTLAQDLGRDAAPVREAPPPTRPRSQSLPQSQPPAQPPEPPPLTTDEGPFRPTSVTPRPSPTPVGQQPSSGFVVQVFSGRDQDQAKRVVQTLESDGYQAYLSPVKVGSQMRYRVRIGPFDDRIDAEGVERIVRQKYRYETWVTSAEN